MKNNNFPPYLNSNYMGLDPITGFDFELGYFTEDEEFFPLAKFRNMDMEYKEESFNWILSQGLIDNKSFAEYFGIEVIKSGGCQGCFVSELDITKSPEFFIRFPEWDKSYNAIGQRILSSNKLKNMQLALMPGRRIVVVKVKGESKNLTFSPSF